MSSAMTPAVEAVLSQGVDALSAALRRAVLPAPAYAVALWGSGEEELDPGVICIGLEPDRAAALAQRASDPPIREVWNVGDFALTLRPDPDLRTSDAFLAAERRAIEDLHAAGIWDPQGWVYSRIARNVGERPPIADRTDDFVIFSFMDDFGAELLTSIMFSGGPAVQLLEERGLLPDA
jgi:hypothetical protein